MCAVAMVSAASKDANQFIPREKEHWRTYQQKNKTQRPECYKGSGGFVGCSRDRLLALLEGTAPGYGPGTDWRVELAVVVGDGQYWRGGVGDRYGLQDPARGEDDAAWKRSVSDGPSKCGKCVGKYNDH